MKRVVMFFVLMVSIIALINTSQAQLGYFCVDDNSIHNWTLDSDNHELEEPCPWGCNPETGMCFNDNPNENFTFAIMFMWFAIALLMLYLSLNIDSETHGIIQVMFMVLSLYMIWNMIGTAYAASRILNINIFDSLLQANTGIWLWVIVFVVFYIMLFFFVFFFKLLSEWKTRRRIRKKGELGDSMGMSRR